MRSLIKNVFLFIIFLQVVFPHFLFAKENIKVVFKDSAQVKTKYIYFKDIAEVEGKNATLILNTQIGYAPSLCKEKKLDLKYLSKKLKRQFSNYTINSQNNLGYLIVKRECQKINEEDLRAFLKKYLMQKLKEKKFEIQYIKMTGKSKFAPGKIDFKIVDSNFYTPKQNNLKLKIKIKVDGKTDSQNYIFLKYNTFEKVLCAKRDIKENQTLKADDFYFISKKDNQLPYDFIDSFSEIKNKIAIKDISKNRILSQGLIKKEILINKGDKVKIVVEDQKIKIITSGFARESGAIDDFIKVISPSSNKELTGKIINKSTVKVTP